MVFSYSQISPTTTGQVANLPAARRRAQRRMEAPEIRIEVDLGMGSGEATIWTCDLSYDYVKINAEYTT